MIYIQFVKLLDLPKGKTFKKALFRMQFYNCPNLIWDCFANVSERSLARRAGEGEAAPFDGRLVQGRVQFHHFPELNSTDKKSRLSLASSIPSFTVKAWEDFFDIVLYRHRNNVHNFLLFFFSFRSSGRISFYYNQHVRCNSLIVFCLRLCPKGSCLIKILHDASFPLPVYYLSHVMEFLCN